MVVLAAPIAGFSSVEFCLIAVAVMIAGVSKGGFGGSAGFLASAILALFLTPSAAIGVMLPLLLLMDFGTVRSFWRQWDTARLQFLVLTSVVGIAIGAWFFKQTNENTLRILIGLLSIVFVVWHIWPKSPNQLRVLPNTINFGLGILTGFAAFVGHAGGPTSAIYLLGQKLPKTTYHATVAMAFLVMNSIKAVPYAAQGIATLETLKLSVIFAPGALLGVWLGIKAHRFVSERVFFTLTYTLLLCAGLKLLYDAWV
jgi:uncharacterized membrane protein YfcA